MESNKSELENLVAIETMVHTINNMMNIFYFGFKFLKGRKNKKVIIRSKYSIKERIPRQLEHMYFLVELKDDDCFNHLRMSRNAFGRLSYILGHLGGLVETNNVSVPEQVAIFLSIVAHHKKNKIVKFEFVRSGRTISKYFSIVLSAILKLGSYFLVKPEPVANDSSCNRWKWFKGCLGALDGTYIPVKVRLADKPRYRSRKGDITVNVLGVCDKNMSFSYVLTGWEGSAADGRVLRDAINRPNGLKIPKGQYYIADCGYTNGEGFLTPYRGTMYHIKDWDNRSTGPQNYQEYFNFRHAAARNVIERTFGLLKMRWATFRSTSFYDIKKQNKIIMACWSIEEEEALLEALLAIIKSGWKSDNGFRTGYCSVLEAALQHKFSGCDLKADPHIQSKIHVWKKTYGSLSSMLARSGFGWSESRNMIIVDSIDVWESYVRVDPSAKGMRFKSYPFYPAWCEAFGKERATGENAIDIGDAADLEKLVETLGTPETFSNNFVSSPVQSDTNEHSPIRKSNNTMHSVDSPSRKSAQSNMKRKADDNSVDERFLGIFANFSEMADKRMQELNQRIGYKQDASESRKAVFEALSVVPGLSLNHKLWVAKKLCDSNSDRDLFFSLPKEAKIEMINMMMSSSLN